MNEKIIQFIKNNLTSIITLIALVATIKTKVETNEKLIAKLENQIVLQAKQDIEFYKEIQKSMSSLIYKIGKLEGRK